MTPGTAVFEPVPVLSKRAKRRLAHTTTRVVVETHMDGRERVVMRGRLDMSYLNRSKY